MISLTCAILKTKQTNKQNKIEMESDAENKLVSPESREVEGRMK